ncbi:39S ribosomal protein L10, mitochondrial-like [Xyrauchen texanus]|uniref:39S ribosomal protein L10, mitochondrial-like n=1 Tax=Xyrauchen texanus TaxID=154827 RepID=UPI00224273E3|nr:39S ribosomal protein L10, mitochondrial-like [Xyrauchen texanus]
MAATLCGKLLPRAGWLPLTQSVRHGSKAVTRHRRPVHFLKQKLLALTEYIPPTPVAPPGALAPRVRKTEEESGLAVLLRKDLESLFKEFKMIAVVQNNATNAEDMLLLKHRLKRHNINVKFFPNQVMRSFLSDSKYSNMLPLFIGQTVIFVCKEPKVKEMLQVLRGTPQMVLLGACIENTLLSYQGIVIYSKLPSMTTVQGELVSGLTMLTSQTVSLLHRHPAHLSALLQQYVKQQGAGDASEAVGDKDAPKIQEATP